MGLFFPDEKERFTGLRKSGFPRYREVLEGSWKDFLKVGFITLLFYIPLAAGVAYAILSSSSLIAIIAGVVGGAIAGIGYSCLLDLILRRLRDDKGDWFTVWKRAISQNWRAAILPGIVQNVLLSLVIFSCALMLWGAAEPSVMSLVLILFSALIGIMLMTVWWPQVVLFEQKPSIQIKNSILFIIMNFWLVLGDAAIQLLWWAAAFLLLPWTAFLVPLLGVWYILFLSQHLIYPKLDEALGIEEQIEEKFPERLNNE